MASYIDKSAVMAEIKKKLDKHSKLHSFNYGAVKDLESLWNFLDTLEVKEVDLDKEIERFVKSDEFQKASGTIKVTNLLAKHFYELGLKTQKGE